MNKLTAGLNEKQKEAVLHREGPLLIIAGAGSGKTKVLTSRVAQLIADGVSPYEILAITFTNKAADEMKTRIAQSTSNFTSKALWVSTFHSMCNRILRREIEALGYSTRFNIYDTADQESLMKKVLKDLNIDDKKFTPKSVLYAISMLKNNLISPATAARKAGDFFEETVATIYKHYQQRLQSVDSLDFDDLLYLTVELFKNNKEALAYYQDRFKYIFIDEYQDTNYVQYLLSTMLAEKHKNICVVGDPDQSIYGWRGADMSNILNFEKDYPGAKVIFLEQNYRSTEQILSAANAVIKNNSDRRPKNLWTKNTEGDLITVYEAETESEEAVYLAREIERQRRKGYSYKDIAILYRTNAQSRIIEKSLMRYGINYRLYGGLSFFKRKEIKDILAYLQFLNNPKDQIAFERIINTPKRGIGGVTIDKILNNALDKEIGLEESLEEAAGYLSGASCKKVLGFLDLIREFRGMLETSTVTDLTEAIITRTGYLKELEVERTEEARDRIANVKELLSETREFDLHDEEKNLESFLGNIALYSETDNLNDDDKVTLITLHMAKGLEYKVVFITGMEEGIFPHFRSLSNPLEMEEERRLCYVGITRGKEKVYLTRAYTRFQYGITRGNQESRFIGEIPRQLKDYPNKENEETRKTYDRDAVRTPAFGRAAAATAPSEPAFQEGFRLGDKVFHSKFGEGVVVQAEGSGKDSMLSIAFPNSGIKKLMAMYAPIKKINR